MNRASSGGREIIKEREILIVEDDPDVGESLRDGLEREGFRVTWLQSAARALDYVRRGSPHLVILDVRLPDGSGFDVCREIRQAGLHLPILMLTVQGDEVDRILGLEIGADDYVLKPFSLRELVSRIRAHLRRAYGQFSAAGEEVLHVADLVIHRARGQVWRGERLVPLTPTEFRLLAYLSRHPEQVLSRAQLLEGVWGYDAEVENERNVDVFIRRLREKVEADPGRPTLIRTVPGLGYRLVP